MAYRTSVKATSDIIEIYVYGARNFGAAQAELYHAGLVNAFERIADQPLTARERLEFRPPVRLYPYRAHIVVYLVDEAGGVMVVRVLHGRQDWERRLSG